MKASFGITCCISILSYLFFGLTAAFGGPNSVSGTPAPTAVVNKGVAKTLNYSSDIDLDLTIDSTEVPIEKKLETKNYFVTITGHIAKKGGSLVYLDPKGEPWRYQEFKDQALDEIHSSAQNLRNFAIQVELGLAQTNASVIFIGHEGYVVEQPFSVNWDPPTSVGKELSNKIATVKKNKKRINQRETLKLVTSSRTEMVFFKRNKGYDFEFSVKYSGPRLIRWDPKFFRIKKISETTFRLVWAGISKGKTIAKASTGLVLKTNISRKGETQFLISHLGSLGSSRGNLFIGSYDESIELLVKIKKDLGYRPIVQSTYQLGLGFTKNTYKETDKALYSMLALSLIGKYAYLLRQSPWKLGIDGMLTALPLNHSRSGIGSAVRYLALDFFGSYQFLTSSSKWTYRLNSGIYFTTTFGNPDLGYRAILGPSLSPEIELKLERDLSLLAFIKLAFFKGDSSLVDLAHNEKAIGIELISRLSPGRKFFVGAVGSIGTFASMETKSVATSYSLLAGLEF